MERENTFIVHPKTPEQENALKAFVKALKIKFEIANERPYDPDFVAKVQKSRGDYKEGKGRATTIEELNELWK